MKYTCPVCGFDEIDEPPYSPHWLGAEEYCECCGFYFETLSEEEDGRLFTAWREKWIAEGMRWDNEGIPKPNNWNPIKQLRNIGIEIDK